MEYLFKVVVVGDVGSGKTSIIRRYVHDVFSDAYKTTIGVDFAIKILQRSSDIRLQLWDIAGQERFGNLTSVYSREAKGAVIVYDLSKNADSVLKWKKDIDDKVNVKIPVVLFANKSDLVHEIESEKLDRFCIEHGFIGWVSTSARLNTGISEGIDKLVDKMIENAPPEAIAQEEDVVRFEGFNEKDEKRCC